jgi:hypothetical protein
MSTSNTSPLSNYQTVFSLFLNFYSHFHLDGQNEKPNYSVSYSHYIPLFKYCIWYFFLTWSSCSKFYLEGVTWPHSWYNRCRPQFFLKWRVWCWSALPFTTFCFLLPPWVPYVGQLNLWHFQVCISHCTTNSCKYMISTITSPFQFQNYHLPPPM